MEKKFVICNGVRMVEGWPEKIQEAQQIPTYVIGGKEYLRIRYGDESDDWGANEHPCHDCAALKGQFVAGKPSRVTARMKKMMSSNV